ncbi:MAG: transglutaminase domain-containing protein [Blastocatellia bacterium]|nr:transglutaminase domain-containing protein [Blastocatellia bacterium]
MKRNWLTVVCIGFAFLLGFSGGKNQRVIAKLFQAGDLFLTDAPPSLEVERTFAVHYSEPQPDQPPTPDDLNLSPGEDGIYLEALLKSIFPQGWGHIAPEARCLQIEQFVSASLKLDQNVGNGSKILKEGYGFCGGFAAAFNALVRKTGLPAREVNAIYLGELGSHVVSEVFYGGEWHLFDSTFGVFLYSRPTYDGHGKVYSFQELRNHAAQASMFKVVDEPWKGLTDTQARISKAETAFMAEKYGASLPEIYRTGVTEAFPVAFGKNGLVSFPVDADLRQSPLKQIGRLNLKTSDMGRFKSRFEASSCLGQTRPAAFHTWNIRTQPKSRFAITYHCTENNQPELEIVPLRDATFYSVQKSRGQTTFILYSEDGTAIFSVFCPQGVFQVDAIEAMRLDAPAYPAQKPSALVGE